ncbi:hypothetical protein D9M71_409790 [compost metagenome]
MVAPDISAHEAQPRNTPCGQIQIVAQLPRTLSSIGELQDLHEVNEVGIGSGYVRISIAPAHLLEAHTQCVVLLAEPYQRAHCPVVDVAKVLYIPRLRPAQIEREVSIRREIDAP